MQQLYHKQREDLAKPIAAEIDRRSEALAAASPAGHLRFIRVPVLLLHGADDTVIPSTEILWLEKDVPGQYLAAALTSGALTHVEVGGKASLRERLALVHWMTVMIRTARNNGGGKQPQTLPAGTWIVPAATIFVHQ